MPVFAAKAPASEKVLPDDTLAISDYPGPYDDSLQPLSLPVWIWRPEGEGPFPTIVALHGSGGVYYESPLSEPDNIAGKFRYWGKQFAEAGFQMILVDSYTPRGYGDLGLVNLERCDADADISCRALNVRSALGRPWDAYAGLRYAQSLDTTRGDEIGLIGWSQGGSGVLSAMSANTQAPLVLGGHFENLLPREMPQLGFAAAVAVYPGCGMYGYYSGEYQIYAPTRIFIGNADSVVSAHFCSDRTEEASQAQGDIQTYRYDDAGHGYDYLEWDTPAAQDTRTKILEFFRGELDMLFSDSFS